MKSLTPHQTRVAIGIANGQPMKVIASELGISLKTTQYHWKQIKRATHTDSYVALTRWAIKTGLVQL